MGIKILVVFILGMLGMGEMAFAGGAVAMQKNKGAGKQKAQMQAQMQAQVMAQQEAEAQVQAEEELIAVQEAKDEVDLPDLIENFKTTSEAWPLIITAADKQAVVQAFLNDYRSRGVKMKNSALFYSKYIDQFANVDPAMLKMPMDQVIRIIAIMEYDYDNGQDKDQMALKVLGQEGYVKNRQRLMRQQTGQQRQNR